MTDYLKPKFSVAAPSSDQYRDNFDQIDWSDDGKAKAKHCPENPGHGGEGPHCHDGRCDIDEDEPTGDTCPICDGPHDARDPCFF